jgi:hypothetical protein
MRKQLQQVNLQIPDEVARPGVQDSRSQKDVWEFPDCSSSEHCHYQPMDGSLNSKCDVGHLRQGSHRPTVGTCLSENGSAESLNGRSPDHLGVGSAHLGPTP